MKALLLLYSDLLKQGKEKFYTELERNLEVLSKVIGIDSLHASVSARFKDVFDKFPEVCLINSIKDSSVFAAYRGLRKLRGNDVLLVDGRARLSKEMVFEFLNRIHVTVGMVKEKWSGVALIKMRDLDYVIKGLEKNFERSVLEAFYTVRDTYNVFTEFIELKEGIVQPILEVG